MRARDWLACLAWTALAGLVVLALAPVALFGGRRKREDRAAELDAEAEAVERVRAPQPATVIVDAAWSPERGEMMLSVYALTEAEAWDALTRIAA